MKNSLKKRIGTDLFMGAFVKCPHPEMIEAMAIAGMDFAVIDMEHTPISTTQLYTLKLAADARNFDLIVRVPSLSEEYIKWCLDLDYEYLQIPFVQTKDCAEKAIDFSMFSPFGHRGVCSYVRSANFSPINTLEYLQHANKHTKLILQIENQMGIDNIDEILNVNGFYGIFIGPYDLSQSLGTPGNIWSKEVLDTILYVIKKCKKNHIKIGIFTDSQEGVEFWRKKGIDFIEYASDLSIFINAYKTQFNYLKSDHDGTD